MAILHLADIYITVDDTTHAIERVHVLTEEGKKFEFNGLQGLDLGFLEPEEALT